MKISKNIILLLCLLLCEQSFALATDKTTKESRIQLVTYLIDNNLLVSEEVSPNDITLWEPDLANTFRQKGDYERMFIIKQMAVYTLGAEGRIIEALDKSNNMLQEAKQMNYNAGVSIAHFAIGGTYISAGMKSEAIEEYEKAMNLLYETPNSGHLQERVLIQLIPALIQLKRMNEAEIYLNRMSTIYENTHRSRFLLYAFHAQYFSCINDLNKVSKYINDAESWYKKYPVELHFFMLKFMQANYARLIGDEKRALDIYTELTGAAHKTNARSSFLTLRTALAQLYTKTGDYKKACEIYQKLNTARDSIKARNYISQINLLRTVYQVNHLEMSNQNQRNRLLFYLIWGSVTILTIFVFFVFYIHKKNKRLVISNLKLDQARKNAENSIRTKSLFLSNMSHEIRTPLNALSGFSGILTEANIDNETRQQCNDIIQQNSDLLLKLIDDVVDLSSLEFGKMQFRFANHDAVFLCQNVIDTVDKIKQTAASVQFHTSLDKLELCTDEARLQQLLINLLINATKFTSEGSIVLSLEIQDNGMALFAVADTGCGIAPEKQSKIFNRFEKLNENAQGSGLGLSICQLIIERFGGEIWIDAEYKNGARFLFTHPIRPINREEKLL